MPAVVYLDKIIAHEAHEDAGNAEWKLHVTVNGDRKTYTDAAVKDGQRFVFGKDDDDRDWFITDFDRGDYITFAAELWEEDPWPNPDDRLGVATESESFDNSVNDFPVSASNGDYTMYFDVLVI